MAGFERPPGCMRIGEDHALVADYDMAIGRLGNGGAGIVPDAFLARTGRVGIGMAHHRTDP